MQTYQYIPTVAKLGTYETGNTGPMVIENKSYEEISYQVRVTAPELVKKSYFTAFSKDYDKKEGRLVVCRHMGFKFLQCFIRIYFKNMNNPRDAFYKPLVDEFHQLILGESNLKNLNENIGFSFDEICKNFYTAYYTFPYTLSKPILAIVKYLKSKQENIATFTFSSNEHLMSLIVDIDKDDIYVTLYDPTSQGHLEIKLVNYKNDGFKDHRIDNLLFWEFSRVNFFVSDLGCKTKVMTLTEYKFDNLGNAKYEYNLLAKELKFENTISKLWSLDKIGPHLNCEVLKQIFGHAIIYNDAKTINNVVNLLIKLYEQNEINADEFLNLLKAENASKVTLLFGLSTSCKDILKVILEAQYKILITNGAKANEIVSFWFQSDLENIILFQDIIKAADEDSVKEFSNGLKKILNIFPKWILMSDIETHQLEMMKQFVQNNNDIMKQNNYINSTLLTKQIQDIATPSSVNTVHNLDQPLENIYEHKFKQLLEKSNGEGNNVLDLPKSILINNRQEFNGYTHQLNAKRPANGVGQIEYFTTKKQKKAENYTGTIVSWKKSGYGIYTNKLNHYKGEFTDDNITGYGKYYFDNKHYKGFFLEGSLNGFGQITEQISNYKVIGKGKFQKDILINGQVKIFDKNQELESISVKNGILANQSKYCKLLQLGYILKLKGK